MPYSENAVEIMKKKTEEISYGINSYMLDPMRVTTKSVFPNDPSIKYQDSGLFKNSNPNFMDINSEILNITRPLTKDIKGMWTGGDIVDEIELKDTNFSSKYSRLDEPAFELRGQTKNRWYKLPIDPQENAIESFKRNGTNTHLTLIDNYKC